MTSTELTGSDYIKAFATKLTTKPGVYRMIDGKDQVLYVGKAKNLKNRVMTYATKGALPTRILRMISQTVRMEVVTTRSEAEALLLEASLIKQLKPIYNILLKDDKSYPYILLTGDHDFPQIKKHRGAKSQKGDYYGPFASVGAMNQTLSILQRAFLLRPCADTIFKNRSRPCLQYQIKRCSAPCVDRISIEDYAELVAQAKDFLSGKNRQIQETLVRSMQEASDAQDYEKAATQRDRIRVLTQIQQEQGLAHQNIGNADVIGVFLQEGRACVQIFFFRAGQAYGNRSFFPKGSDELEAADYLEAFIGQFYQDHPPPKQIYVSHNLRQSDILEEALSMRAEQTVTLSFPKRGEKKELVAQVVTNAQHALGMHIAEYRQEIKHLTNLAEIFHLAEIPGRIEVYDNSHIMGTHAIGAMIVAGVEGFEKKHYRRFSIRNSELAPGDDYAMMREVMTRRLSRLQREDPDRNQQMWPDLLLIDGGKGQLSAVMGILEELGISDLPVVAIAKGPDRNAGREQFFMPERTSFELPINDPTLHYLQRLRDEAHRFAISSHRIKRANALKASELDQIPGIGATRKKALLHHFGSSKDVAAASLSDIEHVSGISKKVAKQIYDFFHES